MQRKGYREMNDEERKILALLKRIEEEFTDVQIKAILVNLLLFIHQNDEVKAIQYLEKLKIKFNKVDA